MVVAPVTKTDATAALGNVPNLEPRPNFKNINAMEEALIDALEAIPSNQSEDYGYRGMIESAARYALICTTPWIWVADPGPTRRGTDSNPHPTLGTTLTREQVASEQSTWEAYREAYRGEERYRLVSGNTGYSQNPHLHFDVFIIMLDQSHSELVSVVHSLLVSFNILQVFVANLLQGQE